MGNTHRFGLEARPQVNIAEWVLYVSKVHSKKGSGQSSGILGSLILCENQGAGEKNTENKNYGTMGHFRLDLSAWFSGNAQDKDTW